MRNRSPEKTPPSSRFIKQEDTISALREVNECLDEINQDLFDVSDADNLRSKTNPYESVAFFTIDARPTNRASAIANAAPYDLQHTSRLDHYKDTIENRRIILSKTALGKALATREPEFMTSEMNSNQLMWAHRVHIGDEVPAAVQIAYTLNSPENWLYPGNDTLEKVWKKNEKGFVKAAKALMSLTPPGGSLTKSLEVAPPVHPDFVVLSWDGINSTGDVLSYRYPTYEAYLEAWKAKRAQITEAHNVTVLDRGDGEHIFVPLNVNPFDDSQVRHMSKRDILPLITELQSAHNQIAEDFKPDIFRRIKLGVGIGNVEEDQDNLPTGQVITEIESLRASSQDSVFYTPEAKRVLFDTK